MKTRGGQFKERSWRTCCKCVFQGEEKVSAPQILYYTNRAATLSMQQASSHYCCFLRHLTAVSLLPITFAPLCSISRRFYGWGARPVFDPCVSPCNGFVLFWYLSMQHGAGTRERDLILSWLINWPSWSETVTSASVGYGRRGEGAWHLTSLWLSHPRNGSRSPSSPHGASGAPLSFKLSYTGLVLVVTAADSSGVWWLCRTWTTVIHVDNPPPLLPAHTVFLFFF